MNPPPRRALAAAIAAALAFAVFLVLAEVPWPALRHLDAALPAAGHRAAAAHGALRAVATVVTDVGSPVAVDVVSAVAAIWLLVARWWRAAVVVVVARLGELACESVAKAIVARPRPGLLPQLTSGSGPSFPSGHAGGSATVFGVVALVLAGTLGRRAARWVLAAAALLVLAVAASRVLLGVHFPTDVLGGIALGVAWVAAPLAVWPPGAPPRPAEVGGPEVSTRRVGGS